MSQFQFKFDIPSDADASAATEEESQSAPQSQEKEQKDPPSSTEANPKPQFKLIDNVLERLIDRRGAELEYITIDLDNNISSLLQVCSDVGAESESSNILQDVSRQNTDLLPGVYEGGLKVWECSLDLCRYLAAHCEELLTNGATNVLELGCGHGLPACSLLREGLTRNKDVSVMFTDYNDFVLYGVTLSNIILNTSSLATMADEIDASDVANHIVLGAGDWMDMSNQLSCGRLYNKNPVLPQNGRFHLMLAAETTYTEESAQETAVLMARHLEPESGIGLVACKRYYFGVGGGSDAFREAAASQQIQLQNGKALREYRLVVETLQVYDNGVGNIRELLQIKCTQVY